MASENMNSATATIEFPRCYQRHVIKALSVRYFYAALVEILVICVVGTYFFGSRVMAGGYGGASSVLFFSALFWLDVSSSWYYEVTEDGIRFRSRIPLYGPYPKSICHVDWTKQTLVDVQQGKWHNYPTIQLKLAPTDRLRKGELSRKLQIVTIVYNPEDETKVISTIMPVLNERKTQ